MTASHDQPESRARFRLVALLINYVDRGSIATAAPLLEMELARSASQMGRVLAAFHWAYAPSRPVMGWLADRIGAERVLAATQLQRWLVCQFVAA